MTRTQSRAALALAALAVTSCDAIEDQSARREIAQMKDDLGQIRDQIARTTALQAEVADLRAQVADARKDLDASRAIGIAIGITLGLALAFVAWRAWRAPRGGPRFRAEL